MTDKIIEQFQSVHSKLQRPPYKAPTTQDALDQKAQEAKEWRTGVSEYRDIKITKADDNQSTAHLFRIDAPEFVGKLFTSRAMCHREIDKLAPVDSSDAAPSHDELKEQELAEANLQYRPTPEEVEYRGFRIRRSQRLNRKQFFEIVELPGAVYSNVANAKKVLNSLIRENKDNG